MKNHLFLTFIFLGLILGFTTSSFAQPEIIEVSYKTNPNNSVDFYYKKNSIVIEHSDGTVARYEGFEKDGILVKLGD